MMGSCSCSGRYYGWWRLLLLMLLIVPIDGRRRKLLRKEEQEAARRTTSSSLCDTYFNVAVGIKPKNNDDVQCTRIELENLQTKLNLILYSLGLELNHLPMLRNLDVVPNVFEAGLCQSQRNIHQISDRRRQLWPGKFVYFGGGHLGFCGDGGNQEETDDVGQILAVSDLYLVELKAMLKEQVDRAVQEKAPCLGVNNNFQSGVVVEATVYEQYQTISLCMDQAKQAIQKMFG